MKKNRLLWSYILGIIIIAAINIGLNWRSVLPIMIYTGIFILVYYFSGIVADLGLYIKSRKEFLNHKTCSSLNEYIEMELLLDVFDILSGENDKE